MTETQPLAGTTVGASPPPNEWKLPSREEFARFIETEVLGSVGGIEADRRRAVRNMFIAIAITLALAGIALRIGLAYASAPLVPIIFVSIGALMVGAVSSAIVVSGFQNRFKDELIPRLVHFFGDFKYVYRECIGLKHLRASLLFPDRNVDVRASGEDYIAGAAGKTVFECSEITYEGLFEEEDERGNKTESWSRLFKGLFFVADFNKRFDGTVTVLPHGESANLGEPVTLEDPEFGKLFSVYSTDQVLARYVLSPSLMRRILEYRRMEKSAIRFSFRDGVLYAAVETKRDLLDPHLFSPVDARQCMHAFEDMHTILGIVEELNLNTRIWTKR